MFSSLVLKHTSSLPQLPFPCFATLMILDTRLCLTPVCPLWVLPVSALPLPSLALVVQHVEESLHQPVVSVPVRLSSVEVIGVVVIQVLFRVLLQPVHGLVQLLRKNPVPGICHRVRMDGRSLPVKSCLEQSDQSYIWRQFTLVGIRHLLWGRSRGTSEGRNLHRGFRLLRFVRLEGSFLKTQHNVIWILWRLVLFLPILE